MNKLREYLDQHPSQTKRLLGMDYDQLMELITSAQNLYERHQKHQESQKTRIIRPGSGRPPKLAIADQILLTLVYLNQLQTWKVLGVQFGVGESTANSIFHALGKNFERAVACFVIRTSKKTQFGASLGAGNFGGV